MCLIKHFADFTNTSWDVVWDKPIIEIFNIMAFARKFNREQEKAMERWRRRH